MFQKNFNKTGLTAIAMISAMAFAPVSSAVVTTYFQDHEGLDANNSFALGQVGGEGYQVYNASFFGAAQLYTYGPFSAPNGGPGFSAIATGEGGPAQGAQYLNIYSDYNNVDHSNAAINHITSVFKEATIDAGQIGSSWDFSFDAKSSSTAGIVPGSGVTARAFIKTLDPNAGYATTNDISVDMTNLSKTDWASFTLSLSLADAALTGQIFQFGFETNGFGYNDSGVFYDNVCLNDGSISCASAPAVPVPAAVWLFGSGLIGLVGVARRRKS